MLKAIVDPRIDKTYTLYCEARWMSPTQEICDLGCKHKVKWFETKRVTVYHVERQWITAVNYVSDGWGDVLFARDAQGREYRSKDGWDWSAGRIWNRTDKRHYTVDRPRSNEYSVSRTLDGRLIK